MSAKPDEEEEQLAEGTLMSHLLELRSRIMKAVAAVLVVFVCLTPFMNPVFELVSKPLRDALPEGSQMIVTDVAAPFLTPFKTVFFVALFIAMPVVLYQVWAFVAPGLYRREKRFALPLLVSSVILFYCGVAFAYFVVFPLMFAFLTATAPQGVLVMTDISNYLDFVLLLFFAFGVAFEIPVATVLLAATGLVQVDSMAKHRGYVLLGIFVVAAFLTPPDAISQSAMAVPMYLLYEIGIVLSRMLLKQKRQREEEQSASS